MTTTFTLTLTIKNAGLQSISAAGEKVVLVRSFADVQPGNVAWWAFSPFKTNTVSWQDGEYETFVAKTPVQAGETVTANATGQAVEEESVTFKPSGVFSRPLADSNVQGGQYGVVNEGSAGLTFGLQQALEVNDRSKAASPLVASRVPARHFAVYEPLYELYVYLASSVKHGQIVRVPVRPPTAKMVSSYAARVNLSPDAPSATLQYDSGSGRFEPTS